MNGLKSTALKLGRVIAKNSPTILTGLSVAGLVTTVAMGIQATPKAMRILEEERIRLEEESNDWRGKPIPKKEIVLLTWKCYIPTTLMGAATIACIISANSINLKRNAALASVYSLTETALKEYQAKVVETFGETKAQKIKDEIYRDKLSKDPIGATEVIFTGKGNMLCYDAISGRYFKNDIENIRKIQNEVNRRLINENFITLNEVYYELGLSGIKDGDAIGWGMDEGLIEFRFSSQLAEGEQPCLVLDYNISPKYDFRDY